MSVYGYLRVSTEKQGDSRLGLDGQRAFVKRDADYREIPVTEWFEDVKSARDLDRPGLQALLAKLEKGDTVMVATLDRLSRNVGDFSELLHDFNRRDVLLIANGTRVDVHTADGRLQAKLSMVIAEHESDKIGERTSRALQAKLAADPRALDRPEKRAPAAIRRHIRALRDKGLTLSAIAQKLEDEGVPTAQGGRWHKGTVKWVLEH